MDKGTMFGLGCSVGDAISSIVNAVEDKKVNLVEGIDMTKAVGVLAFGAMRNHKALAAGFNDGLNEDEQEELREGFREGFDLSNDQKEETVEKYLALTVDVMGALSRIILKATAAEEESTGEPLPAPKKAKAKKASA